MRLPASLSILLLITVAMAMGFWHLGAHAISEWDEARYGDIAYWMLETGDYFHYLYAGEPDDWVGGPPLNMWLITLAYRVWGYTPWSLRFFSALAAVLAVWVFYRWVRLYRSTDFALRASLILMSCQGIFGHHVGRTGDRDALLLLGLMILVYGSSLYLDHQKRLGLSFAWLGALIAFYSKGTAMGLMLPGLLVYTLVQGYFPRVMRDWAFWLTLTGLLLGISVWFWGMWGGGSVGQQTIEGQGAIANMLFYDTFSRFFGINPDHQDPAFRHPLFLIHALDIKFNLWNYVLYGSLLYAGYRVYQHKRAGNHLLSMVRTPHRQLYVWSLCVLCSYGLLLSLSRSKHVWYVAPMLPFASVWVVAGWDRVVAWKKGCQFLLIGLLLFTMGRHFYTKIHSIPTKDGTIIWENRPALQHAEAIILYKDHRQHVQLYADWLNETVIHTDNWAIVEHGLNARQLLITQSDSLTAAQKTIIQPERVHPNGLVLSHRNP